MKTATTSTRIRASERAVTATLKAMRNAGVPVEKLRVIGGQVEIIIASVEEDEAPEHSDLIEEW